MIGNKNRNSIVSLVFLYSLSCVTSATPLLIQCSAGSFVGILTCMTKFVECPVVASVPLRSAVR